MKCGIAIFHQKIQDLRIRIGNGTTLITPSFRHILR